MNFDETYKKNCMSMQNITEQMHIRVKMEQTNFSMNN